MSRLRRSGLSTQLSDGVHEARRLQQERDAAVRCRAWVGGVSIVSPELPTRFVRIYFRSFQYVAGDFVFVTAPWCMTEAHEFPFVFAEAVESSFMARTE